MSNQRSVRVLVRRGAWLRAFFCLLIATPLLAAESRIPAGEYTISGPFSHKNLTIFFIHGPDQTEADKLLTLQEAIDRNVAVVHETSNVMELAVENISADYDIFIQSSDIVKGGKQDRVIAVDFILEPKSGKVPVATFCVEQRRWSRRGRESVATFSGSDYFLSSKELKLAVTQQQDQRAVWARVAEVQAKLRDSIGDSVLAPASSSSLQLTLENQKVRGGTESYVRELMPLIEDERDVLGFGFAINGEINSADVYASKALFAKFWPKLLRASAVEALAEQPTHGLQRPDVSIDDVKKFLTETQKGEVTERQINDRTRIIASETETSLLYETQDTVEKPVWLRRNYIRK